MATATSAVSIRISRTRSVEKPRRGIASSVVEAVAGAAHGQDQGGLRGIALELLAQVADVHVDCARLAVGRSAPDRLQQLLAAEDAAAMGDQGAQHLELDVGERDPLP